MVLTVNFELTEVAYATIRPLQKFPTIRLPEGETIELTGVDKQRMTLVVSSAEGCKVEIR